METAEKIPAWLEGTEEYRAARAKRQQLADEGRKAELAAIADLEKRKTAEVLPIREKELPKLAAKAAKLKAEGGAAEKELVARRNAVNALETNIQNSIDAHELRLMQTAPPCIDAFSDELFRLRDAQHERGCTEPQEVMALANTLILESRALKVSTGSEAEAIAGIEALRKRIADVRAEHRARQDRAADLQRELLGLRKDKLAQLATN